ncbi:EAL domain-containing protein/glycosyl transferase [Halomicronema hongdechloris C2206]|uniref:EAL domain-containing protein/glycosyl transferase n=1 Tax=Halomicronema hongdechloris C2206 TaxID=1641165 RepID=A0A1Z3HQB6_9CYAN|nr:glycosyltransferase family A protein [Halomicronema hongdechloris]ASC72501.1 EAL domain-containing protein/glycosyl transferase [Halomicronema hongdechloris C2206]
MDNYPFVSVIIPVFNDQERLKLCLDALCQQTYERTRHEIIVVDNGSEDYGKVQHIVEGFEQATVVQELFPSSYAARNKGILLAKGDIIAFTDSDCIPDIHWLEKGVKHLTSQSDCGMVVGRIEVFFRDPQKPTLVELYQSLTAFPQEQHLKEFNGGATANLITFREVIYRVGNFNSSLKSFGDFEWGRRVFMAGYKQVYADDVIVKHPARSSWQELQKRTIRASGGVYDYFLGKQTSWLGKNKMFMRLLLNDLVPPVHFTISTFRNQQLKTFYEKLNISLILLVVRYISALEKIRLRFGGASIRA